jgi:hypothetical protein
VRKKKSHNTIRCEWLLQHPEQFMLWGAHITLRPYQQLAVRAVIESVRQASGLSLVWIFPRQSGKDEALALLMAYLLTFCSRVGGEMVFMNPTFSPQTETSMRRLEARLSTSGLTRGRWARKDGYIYCMENAFCTYLSADPGANIVGATANRLLVVNEAQAISTFKYDKDIEPMVASAHATRLFSGTRWTGDTLLEREFQQAKEAQAGDGQRRVFFFTADDVRQSLPAYGESVDAAVARLGRQHPLVKTQYFCETIAAEIGMFPPGRQALMQGTHSARTAPEPDKTYAFLIDVAGQDESAAPALEHGYSGDDDRRGRDRDSTNLKIVEVDRSTLARLGKPGYLTVFRKEWNGTKIVTVFEALRAFVQTWKPLRVVIDATGVGEGLWSMLDNAFGAEVVFPVKFTAKLKSELGYGFIGMIESGRYREYHPFDEKLHMQLEHCRAEIVPGPARLMRWGVPDGKRDPASREMLHDDDLITGALCVILDGLDWSYHSPTTWTIPRDPLLDMDGRF